jgi:anti-sigma-K factor RskA
MVGAAVMAALLASKMLISEPAVAALMAVDAPMPAFWVMVTRDGYATVIANAAELQPGNTLELWGVPPGATVPVSLGVVPNTGRIKMPAIVPAGTLLLVSTEPRGGSPTGAPTGPVVYQGRMVKG